MTDQMPKIDLELVRGIVSTRGKNKGRLRASKPQVDRLHVGQNEFGLDLYEPEEHQGKTAYIWRMVAFYVSPKRQHHCMPCTADFDVPKRWGDAKRARLAELDKIVDVVVDSIKPERRHGLNRWAQAYGLAGTPQGAIVYR